MTGSGHGGVSGEVSDWRKEFIRALTGASNRFWRGAADHFPVPATGALELRRDQIQSGLADVIALHVVHAHVEQQRQRARRFDAHSAAVPRPSSFVTCDGAHEDLVGAVGVEVADEAAVDLHLIHRHVLEIGERRSRRRVVEREAVARRCFMCARKLSARAISATAAVSVTSNTMRAGSTPLARSCWRK